MCLNHLITAFQNDADLATLPQESLLKIIVAFIVGTGSELHLILRT